MYSSGLDFWSGIRTTLSLVVTERTSRMIVSRTGSSRVEYGWVRNSESLDVSWISCAWRDELPGPEFGLDQAG